MVFLLLPLGKKRHFTNYYGAGQRHLCLLASVLAWHIGPLTQMPEEGKERGDNTLLMQCEIYEKSHKFMWLAFFKLGLKLNWAIWKSSHSQDYSTRFTSNQNLQGHLIKLHSEHYNCYFCKKAFSLDQDNELKLHMFKHEQKILSTCAVTCVQCGKYFR